jgi:hypothetical protein
MTVTVRYHLNENAQREALRRGINAAVKQTISIVDPACILMDHVTIDDGSAYLLLDAIKPNALPYRVEHDEFRVARRIIEPLRFPLPYMSGFCTLMFDLIVTAEHALAAAQWLAGHNDRLLADLPRQQAEADADYELRRAAHVAEAIAEAETAAAKAEKRQAEYPLGLLQHTSRPNAAVPADHPSRARLEAVTAEDKRRQAIAAANEAAEAAAVCRVALTDGSGSWFDSNKAEKFSESTRWNGNNRISRATGSQWEHEALYRTASCRYILNHWSNWPGSTETYEEISKHDAAGWLAINGHDADICCEPEFAALEID